MQSEYRLAAAVKSIVQCECHCVACYADLFLPSHDALYFGVYGRHAVWLLVAVQREHSGECDLNDAVE